MSDNLRGHVTLLRPTGTDGPAVAEPEEVDDEQADNGSSLILPDEFWHARDELEFIREYAHSRATCADGVLYTVLARLSAMVPALCRVDTGIGSAAGASLNLFVAAVGDSGTGKSSSVTVARALYTSPRLDERDMLPLGTGEGIAEAYMGEVGTGVMVGGKEKMARDQVRNNAFIFADEGESLTKISKERNGATLGPALRTAWMGEILGQQNAEKERNRKVENYALGLLIGFQPETVLPLLSDDVTGMAQRFVYCSTIDPTIPTEPPERTVVVTAEKFDPEPCLMTMDRVIRREVWDNRIRRSREGGDSRDSHRDLTRIKLAGLLALLDHRHDINAEDWQLATIMWDVSTRVQAHYLAKAAIAQARSRAAGDDAYAHREGRAERARILARSEEDPRLRRIAHNVAKAVHQKGARTVSAARRTLRPEDRVYVVEAAEYAVEQGWIETDDDHNVSPVGTMPEREE